MAKKNNLLTHSAGFIETMDCLPVTEIPDGDGWTYEIKLDGFRLQAVKTGGEVTIYSRRHNVLNGKFQYIADALHGLPDETVIDGELVALGTDGKPDFNLLQNFRSAEARIVYYAFDILVHKRRDLTGLPLSERRKTLKSVIKPHHHIELSAVSDKSAKEMLKWVKEQGLEGVVAKRADSVYQPGLRTGLWSKHRISMGQEFVVGGYTPSANGVDALVVGFYKGKDLIYTGRVRAGFVPATRTEVFAKIKHLKTDKCPFSNLPEKAAGRWGAGLTAEKMKECVWLKPETVARIDFLEWTGADHLRHTKFVALRDDKDPRKVVKET
jgi:DNA ligase D-like protein (predicted ligase)